MPADQRDPWALVQEALHQSGAAPAFEVTIAADETGRLRLTGNNSRVGTVYGCQPAENDE